MFTNKRILFFIGFSLLIFFNSTAQLISKAVVINSDKGLSQNSVYAICKDSKGFLWIGTGDGLNRYDGKEFVTFRNTPGSKNSLKGFYINYTMKEDNRHCLWFSTERNLVEYNQITQTFTDIVPDGFPGNKYIISIDTLNNTVWFFTAAIGIFSYEYVHKIFKKFEFPVNDLEKNPFPNPKGVADLKGNIWVTSSRGLFCFNKTTSSWRQFLHGKKLDEICIDQKGELWLMNSDSVFSYDPVNGKFCDLKNSFSGSGSYLSIVADHTGKIWIGTFTGELLTVQNESKTLMYAGNINKMVGAKNILEMRCLYADSSNLLWVGTEGGGVIKLDMNPTNFYTYPSITDDPVNSLFIKSIFCDDDGKVWLGTFKKGVYIFDPNTKKATKFIFPKNLNINESNGTVYCIKKDNEGNYLITFNGTLISYNKKNNRFLSYPIPLLKNEDFSLINHIRVEKNYILLSTITGLYKLTINENPQKFRFSRLLNFAVSESMITEDNSLWVSSLYTGLVKISSREKRPVENLAVKNGIRCILEDKQNHMIWAASQTGLLAYHMLSGKSKFYNEKNGLLNGYLYGIVKNGNEIWVSCNKGLAKGKMFFKPGETFPEISFKAYSKEDGLQSNEFNTGAYAQSNDGTIFFGGINGLNWFKPEKITINKNKPSVAITNLLINDKKYEDTPSVEYLNNITTPYNHNTFTIKYTGLEFTNPQNIHFRFKLDGLENNWTTEVSPHEVRYANLSPGKYIFRVAAFNSDNKPSDEARLSITILPPFYDTSLFRLSMAVSILIIIVFITQKTSQLKLKNRIRILEKEKALEAERLRISKEMHDDLGAGLTQISLISEAAKRRNKEGRFPGEELKDIAETSKQLIENVSEIIWAMNPDFDTLSAMIAYLREQITKLLEYSTKKLKLQMPEDFIDRNIANTKRKNILMLVKEAVNNAVKHSEATLIEVNLYVVKDTLQIEIKDNGIGFDITQPTRGNGLKNFNYRSGLLNGTAEVISGNSGTQITFNIPL